jgi:hypothetical protein
MIMMHALAVSCAMFAAADAMSTPAVLGFELDVVQAADGGRRRSLQTGGRPPRNDINICAEPGIRNNYITADQTTGTIHDDAVSLPHALSASVILSTEHGPQGPWL